MVNFHRFLSLLLLMVYDGLGTDTHMIRAYNRDGKGRERQISENGNILQIGQFPALTIGTKNSHFKCTEFQNLNDYQDKYFLTNVSSLTGSNYPKADIKQENLEDYFFVLKKELWSCTEDDVTADVPEPGKDARKPQSFYRVVNELMGITEIGVIRHPKTIKVKTKYYLGDKKTAWVREIAYYTSEKEGVFDVPCYYDGRITLEPSHHEPENKLISSVSDPKFRPYQGNTDTENQKSTFLVLELKYFPESRPIQFADDEITYAMSLGSKMSEFNLGQKKSSTAVCYEMQGVRPYPFSYRPVVMQHVKVTTADSEYRAFHVMEEFYYELIVPAKEEVWLCRIIEGVDKDKQFYRIVNEVVSRKPIRQVYFHHTIVYVAEFSLPNDKKGFKCREIKYVEPETGKTVNYHGYVRFYKEKRLEKNLRDMKYTLIRAEPNCIFRTLVGPRGYDFRVGSRWDKIIGDHTASVRCKKADIAYNNAFKTQIRFKIRVRQIAYSTKLLATNREPEFLEYKLSEVLQCSSTDGKITFLRVKNAIDFEVAIHEIESYDGVRISYKDNFDGPVRHPVRIIEVKYLEPGEFSVLKYDGQLEIMDSTDPPIEDFMYKIKKKKDDIVPIVGQHQEKYANLRDLVYSKHARWQLLLNSKGTYNLSLSVYPSERLGSVDDVADCSKSSVFYYTTVALHNYRPTGRSVLPDDHYRNSTQSKYINTISQRQWVCQFQNKDKKYVFRRSVNEAVILRQSPEPIKYVNYPDNVELRFVARNASEYNMEFRNTFYTSITSNLDVMYLGQLVIKGKEKEVANQLWASGTKPVPREEPIPKKVSYERPGSTLDKHYMYKTVVTDGGLITLQLGSHWELTVGTENDIIECREITDTLKEEIFNTFFKTKVKRVDSGSSATSTRSNVFDEYFESLKKELWLCENTDIRLWRIVNQFSIKQNHCDKIKELIHSDGFTFMVGDFTYQEAGCMEVVEIKFIDTYNKKLFKYEGKVVLKSSDDKIIEHKIQAESLKNIAKKDQYYLFDAPEPTVFRKSIRQNGYILEIKDKTTLPKLVLANHQSHFRCQRMSDEDVMNEIPDRRIVFNLGNFLFAHELKDNKIKSSEIKLKDCFYFISLVWKCQAKDEEKFYRVVNLAVTRDREVTENGKKVVKMCELARIYHSASVMVNAIRSDANSIAVVQIRQIGYFTAQSIEQVQFEGFISDDIDETNGVHELLQFVTKDVRYRPTMLHSNFLLTEENNEKRHKSIEIGSTWLRVIGEPGDVAWCMEINHPYVEEYGTSIYSSNREVQSYSDLSRVDDETSIAADDFKMMNQQIYQCVNRKGDDFLRIVNVLLDVSKQFTAIYHHDGVSVDSQYMPDGSKLVKITEVKYLRLISKDDKRVPRIIRYDGKVTIVSNTIEPQVRKLFQIPSDLEQDPRQIELELAKGDASRYWPLEMLKVHALKRQVSSDDELAEIKYTTFEDNKQKPHTKVIENGRNGRILVGSPWVRKIINQNDDQIKCILDEWNPSNYLQFDTNVVVYINDVHYVLDEETLLDYFKLVRLEIWICGNDEHTFLRLVTELKGLIPLQVVEYYDGVEVVPISLESSPEVMTAQITEQKYVDAKTFEVVQLEEVVRLYKKKVEKPSDDNNSQQKVRRNFRLPERTKTSKSWWRKATKCFSCNTVQQ